LNLASGGTYTGVVANFLGTPPPTTSGYSTACSTFTPNGKTIASMTINALWTGYVNGVSYSNYNSALRLGGAVSYAATATTTLTSGTLNLNGYSLTTGNFTYTSGSIASILFNTGTINLVNTVGQNVLNMPNLTNFTNDQNGGFTAGTAGYMSYTLGTTGNTLQSQANSNLKFTFTGGTNAPVFDNYSTIGYADFSAAPGSTLSVASPNILNVGYVKNGTSPASVGQNLTFKYLWPQMGFQTSEQSITSVTIQPSSNASAPKFVLTGNLTLSGALTYVANGSIDLQGYNITAANFTANSGANTGNIVCTNGSTTSAITLTGSSYVWNSQKLTMFSNVNVNLSSTSTKYVDGGGNTTFGKIYNTGTGALVLQNSDTFADLTMTAKPSTLTFTTGKTPTFTNFHPSGSTGSLIAINSSTPGVQANITVNSAVSIDYVTVQDIKALVTSWYAGTNSTDLGDNTNVIFSTGGSNIKGQFFAFF
jgi:hypothetical protein